MSGFGPNETELLVETENNLNNIIRMLSANQDKKKRFSGIKKNQKNSDFEIWNF